MDSGSWTKPVFLERYGQPGTIAVSNIRDAARLLLKSWASPRTEPQSNTLRTFKGVLEGRTPSALARCDFIAAAMEAGYYVLPETFLASQGAPGLQVTVPRTDTGLSPHLRPTKADGAVRNEPEMIELLLEWKNVTAMLVTTLLREAARLMAISSSKPQRG